MIFETMEKIKLSRDLTSGTALINSTSTKSLTIMCVYKIPQNKNWFSPSLSELVFLSMSTPPCMAEESSWGSPFFNRKLKRGMGPGYDTIEGHHSRKMEQLE